MERGDQGLNGAGNSRQHAFAAGALAVAAALGMALTGSGCARSLDSANTASSTDTDSRDVKATARLTVIDMHGRPISGAHVLIGPRAGVPFTGNFVVTDSKGALPALPAWTSALPVTIDAPGFVRATYVDRMPNAGALILRATPSAQQILLSGSATGFGKLSDDGWVQLGLIFPAISRADIGAFQISTFISSATDRITVAGQSADVPSNTSLPRQTLRYLFMQATFNKPRYRTFFEQPGTVEVVAAHARFKLSEGVNAIQSGKSFLEMVNLMDFREAAVRDVAVVTDGPSIDLVINQIQFSSHLTATAPRFGSDRQVYALALAQTPTGALFPTDVKRLNSGESKSLASVPDGGGQTLFVAQPAPAQSTGASSEAMSLRIGVFGAAAPDMLTIPQPPMLKGGTATAQALALRPPAALPGAVPGMVFASLSGVQQIASGKMKLERKLGRWDIYAAGWPTSLEVPLWPLNDAAPTVPLRWQAAFAAFPQETSGVVLGPKAFEKASHIAKSAIDL